MQHGLHLSVAGVRVHTTIQQRTKHVRALEQIRLASGDQNRLLM
jgi:hypothetical protein